MDSSNAASRRDLAIVTGASSGIGRAIATGLARRGYRTVLISRRKAVLDQLAAELSLHAPSRSEPLDLMELDAIAPTMERIAAIDGRAQILVNCAGRGIYQPFQEQRRQDFEELMRVNFESVVEMTRAFLAASPARGHVFNICSMASRVGPLGHASYAASKGAMRAFTEVMQAEHARDDVRFTVVYPGIVSTPYFEKGTMAALWPKVKRYAISAEVVADVVLAAIGRDRLVIYVPRKNRALDWIAALSARAARWTVLRGVRNDV